MLAACDPGFRYRPQQWQADKSSFFWTTSIGEIRLQHWGIGDLIGSRGVTPEFEIRNTSPYSLVIERAELITASGRQTGKLPQINGKDAVEARTVRGGATRRIAVLWEFPTPALDVLGPAPQIVIEYRLNDRPERLVINYERVD
jgi:hypothetical protein